MRKQYLLYILPALQLCLCLAIGFGLNKAEGGWMWFPAFLVNFPFSILLLPVLRIFNHPMIVFGIGGSFWWYFLGRSAVWLFKKAQVAAGRPPAP